MQVRKVIPPRIAGDLGIGPVAHIKAQCTMESVIKRPLHESGVFWRLDEATIRQLLRLEGWQPTVVNNPPGQVFPPHRHETTRMIAVIHGGIDVRIGHETFHCLSGDKLVVPAGAEHAAVVGPNGCHLFWGAKTP